MYRGTPGNITSKRFTANDTIDSRDMKLFNRAVLGSSGVRIKIPQADYGEFKLGNNLIVKNEADGFGCLWRDDAFGSNNDTMLVAPDEEFEIECVDLQSSSTFRWDKRNAKRPSLVTASTPTPTWTGTAPTVTSNYMWSSVITNGQAQALFFHGRIVISDGNGATGLTLPLPTGVIPEKLAVHVPIDARVSVDSSWTDAEGYIDISNSTAATRAKLQFGGFPTLTDTKEVEILYSGFVPLCGWTSFSPITAYGVGTASPTEAGYYMLLGPNTYAMIVDIYDSSDSDGESSVTVVPPMLAPDMDVYGTCMAKEIAGAGGATVSNPIASIDMANATAESRYITNLSWTIATDGQAFRASYAAILPINNWQEGSITTTYGTADPTGTLVESLYWDAYDNMVFIVGYISFTDGNGCTSVQATGLPIPPRAQCARIAIPSCETQHSDTFVNPMVILDSDDTDPDDRAAECDNLTTYDDTEVGKLQFMGWYFV